MMQRMLAVLGLVLAFPVWAQLAEERVTLRGDVSQDVYAAGGTVDIRARAAGDVVAAGGDVTVGEQVEGDVIAAGGTVTVGGQVADDVRAAGGTVAVDAQVGDHLVAAGGHVRLAPGGDVSGWAWLAGGDVEVAGHVGGELRAVGGAVTVSGTIDGDVLLEGGDISILPETVIGGDLLYRSPAPIEIPAGARIQGTVTHEQVEWESPGGGYGFVFVITMAVAGIVLAWLFPHFTRTAADTLRSDPWASLGMGLAVLIVTPLAALAVSLVVLGLWVGLVVLALYLALLPVGFLVASLSVAERGAALLHRDISTLARLATALAITLVLLGLVRMIPFVGGVLFFLLLVWGLGAAVVQLYRLYHTSRERQPA